MFLVLFVHADFFSLGTPDLSHFSLDSLSRIIVEVICIPCVDIFICISGWFGIKPNMKSISNFLFQCFFFLIGIYVIFVLSGRSEISVEGFKWCFVLTRWNWFIKAYLVLYILSPVLNAFVESASRRVFRNTLLFYFVFQTIYGWYFEDSTTFFQGGYSPLSFIGFYLLMRYIRLYDEKLKSVSLSKIACFYVGITVIVICLCFMPPPIYSA